MKTPRLDDIALLVIRERRLGLALAPQSAWQDRYGLRMLRLDAPGAAFAHGGDPLAQALALAPAVYGCAATPLPTRWTYGPSSRHAIDRAPAAPDEASAPFLRVERMRPVDAEAEQAPRIGFIAVYRAALTGPTIPVPSRTSAILWLTATALGSLVRGALVGDLLQQDGVTMERARGVGLPDDALIYLPSDHGERTLLRIAAKYGDGALFASPPSA